MTHDIEKTDSISFSQDDNVDLSLGFKEMIFLAIIFFFGFSGFGICVDKIYASNPEVEEHIKSVILHDEAVSTITTRTAHHGFAIQ